MFEVSNSVVQKIEIPELSQRGIELYIKRDDLIHEVVSGNKWRKLKYNIARCQNLNKKGILTFGGAFSNHLIATAYACAEAGVKSIGVVRGEELTKESNATLHGCNELGMQLHFVSREEYSQRNEKYYQEELGVEFSNYLVVPEGGANYYGIIGCQEIMSEVDVPINHIFVAQGTTTTSCGVLLSMYEGQKLHVVPVLKGFESRQEMLGLLTKSLVDEEFSKLLMNSVEVYSEYHFGGYGKYSVELLQFIQSFFQKTGIKLDPIYTGKAMYGLMEEIKSSSYDNSNVLFIHTGGIQGTQSIVQKSGVNLFE